MPQPKRKHTNTTISIQDPAKQPLAEELVTAMIANGLFDGDDEEVVAIVSDKRYAAMSAESDFDRLKKIHCYSPDGKYKRVIVFSQSQAQQMLGIEDDDEATDLPS